MMNALQDWIWYIGGFLFTVSLFIAMFAWIWNFIVNKLVGWNNKKVREDFFYWIKHKEEIAKIIEDKKSE